MEEDLQIQIDEDDDEGSDPEDKFNQAHGEREAIQRRLRNRPQGHYAINPKERKKASNTAVAVDDMSANSMFNLSNQGIIQANNGNDNKQSNAYMAYPQGQLQRKGRQI